MAWHGSITKPLLNLVILHDIQYCTLLLSVLDADLCDLPISQPIDTLRYLIQDRKLLLVKNRPSIFTSFLSSAMTLSPYQLVVGWYMRIIKWGNFKVESVQNNQFILHCSMILYSTCTLTVKHLLYMFGGIKKLLNWASRKEGKCSVLCTVLYCTE